MVTHIGEKPHQCSACKKYFTTIINLNRHLLTHTRKKPYPCKLCDKTFLRNYDWLFILFKKNKNMCIFFSQTNLYISIRKCVLNNAKILSI